MSTADWREGAEPGFDLHSWESRWAVEEDADGDPDAARSQYADLVERMLEASGYAVHDPIVRHGEEHGVVATYVPARELAERAELGSASRAEVKLATEDLRSILDSVLRRAGLR